MLTHRDLANLQLRLYNGPPTDREDYKWAVPPTEIAGVSLAVAVIGDICCVAFEGTHDLRDVIRDLECPMIRAHNIGKVHPGAYTGIEQVWRELKSTLWPKWCVGGHSLGAMHSTALCAEAEAFDLRDPVAQVLWGCPAPGDGTFARWQGSRTTNYRNIGKYPDGRNFVDPFTRLPRSFPLERYRQVCDFTDLCGVPKPDDPWNAHVLGLEIIDFSPHRMDYYAAETPETSIL